ncbi:MAG TPA: UDP-glucose 4-epimerase GalE [Thiobacillaceae bacterium]|nr:UDP-glucose 4-epimerase GalE [Thiobacillaceae bacterium]
MGAILITGGAGYIGSHTCVEMIQAGMEPVVVDNLSNSKPEALRRVERITGRPVVFHQVDIRDRAGMARVFEQHDIDAVVHFAGLKAVGESVAKPLEYYDNNVAGTVTLCQVMAAAGVKNIVFSSSATVYGDPHAVPIREDFPVGATTNPYGRSKFIIEEILRDLHVSDPDWRIVLLRYFNPVGAHESGLIGEDPNGIPNNLMPYIAQVAVGRRPYLNVFGNDYPTPDGTGVRDYIHVVDLALGHVAALRYLAANAGVATVNLGTGQGYSVLDMIKAFSAASGRQVAYEIAPRRAGDIARCYADPALAERLFGWRATRGVREMCADTWRWQHMNPQGYGD